MFQQAGDMQQRRFAGPRWRHKRDRLPGPDREIGSREDVERLFALPVMPFDAVHIEDGNFLGAVCRRVTHSAAPPPDRGALPATTDRAWRGRKASAPSP